MKGRSLVLGLALFTAVFAAGLWYAQVYAWWTPVDGLDSVRIAGADVAVRDYRGLDGDSSPLKLRGCFRLDPAAVDAPPAADPAPLVTPGWFDCFDAAALGAALEAGEARAVEAGRDPEGFRRVVAIFPDGRAFLWREVLE